MTSFQFARSAFETLGPLRQHESYTVYFGAAVDLPAQLAAARSEARAERLAANRAMTCDQCSGQPTSSPASQIPP